MKIGTFVPFVSNYATPAHVIDIARRAEELGFHSIFVVFVRRTQFLRR